MLLGIGTAMVYPTLLAVIGDVAHPSWRASAVGVYRFWRDLGFAAGALLSGVVADMAGFDAAIWTVAGVTAFSGVIVVSGCMRPIRAGIDRGRRIALMERRTINDLLADARARLQRLGPEEAYAAMEHGALLIDTRCAELRRRDGSIPGSVHVPLSVLFWRLDPSSGHDDPNCLGRWTARSS